MLRRIRIGYHHADHNLAAHIPGTGDIKFLTADDPFITIEYGTRRDISRIGRSHAGLGHGKGRAYFSRQQRLQPLLLLCFRAITLQYFHVARIRCAAIERFRREPAAPHDLSQVGVFEIRNASTALTFWQEEIPQAQSARLIF